MWTCDRVAIWIQDMHSYFSKCREVQQHTIAVGLKKWSVGGQWRSTMMGPLGHQGWGNTWCKSASIFLIGHSQMYQKLSTINRWAINMHNTKHAICLPRTPFVQPHDVDLQQTFESHRVSTCFLKWTCHPCIYSYYLNEKATLLPISRKNLG